MKAHLPALALALAAHAAAQHAAPPVFQDLSFEDARAKAASEGRLFVLDAMTSWCGPCKVMDRTTWVDPLVELWFERHGLALQLDMDEHEALKQQLGITAFPTIIAFEGVEEFDRIVGSRDAAEMCAWLENARAGKREVDTVLAELAAVRATEAAVVSVGRRARLAAALAQHGRTAEALEQTLVLWEHTPDDAQERQALESWRRAGGRFLARDLVASSGTARAEFERVRNAQDLCLAAGDERRRDDWIELNFILGDEAPTVAWATQLAARPEARGALQQRERRLFDLLVDAGQWAAAGHALRDPVAELDWRGRTLGAYDTPRGDAAAAPAAVPLVPLVAPGDAERPRVTPAIPLVAPGAQRAPAAVPAVPLAAPGAGSADDDGAPPATVPAIPLVAPGAPAAGAGDPGARAVPAIPMVPVQARGPERGGAVPMIPMTGGPSATRAARPETPEDVAREVRARLTAELRRIAARRYGALLAAERDADAARVAETLVRHVDDAGARAGLIAGALRAGRFEAARARHLAWLDHITYAR